MTPTRLTQQHIRKLSSLMTPTHKDLRIPRIYHFECPWPAAQHDILMINAYKVTTYRLASSLPHSLGVSPERVLG